MNPSILITPNYYGEGKLLSIIPTDGSGDMDVVRATTATLVNSEGVIENVAINVPRLDYTNGSCPSILVEPQRTNLLLNSVFSGTGTFPTSWNTSIATGTSSPIASTKSTLVQAYIFTTSNSRQVMFQNQSYVNGNKYSVSVYVENVVGNIEVSNMILQLGTGTILYYKNGQQILSTDFIESGNIYTSVLSATASSTSQVRIGNGCGGNTTGSITLSMPQFEVGSNATSYIPTTSSTVTRNADVISKTGISDLIGQTEGTLFVDVELKNIDAVYRILGISDNTTANRIYMSIIPNNLEVTCFSGGLLQFINTSLINLGRYKIALSYKINDFKLYVNGSLLASDNSAIVPLCPNLYLGQRENSSGTFLFNNYINSALLFKTALTDTELATLTTL